MSYQLIGYEFKIFASSERIKNNLFFHALIYDFNNYEVIFDLSNNYKSMLEELLSDKGFLIEYFEEREIINIIITGDLYNRLEGFSRYFEEFFDFNVELNKLKENDIKDFKLIKETE